MSKKYTLHNVFGSHQAGGIIMITIGELGERAARYHLGGYGLNAAAGLVLDEALSERGLTYPEVHTQIQRLGRLNGFASFYVPNADYRRLMSIAVHELPQGENNFNLIMACALVMIRVQAARCILLRRVHRNLPPPTESRNAPGHLTLKELGLRCIRDSSAAGRVLRDALDSHEVTYESLYHELVWSRREYGGVFYAGETTVEDMMVRCGPDSDDLIVGISTALVGYYTRHTLDWDNDAAFGTPPRRGLRKLLGR